MNTTMNTKATAGSSLRRRILFTTASVLTAGALAVGSGASFTAQTQNPGNSAVAGTLEQTNSLAGSSIFNLSNMKPGDTVNGKVTVTNSGTLAANLKLTESGVANGFGQPAMLSITVTDVTTAAAPVVVASKRTFGTVGAIELGKWAAGESRTYVFSVTIDAAADNTNQGDRADATYTWDSVQDTAVVVNQHF
ncbi:TasA family protein [Nocardioides piscis]|uniref:Camelysin metallo-endopeptidase n=1 Tax=Nocardioides piscis TaxID=2714938 RepID=A0A6G7YG77_9ACTN|nr:TasA family protein [Nocardioides piscis]QIK75799.1 hypothetical protein G7071_10455 [Nocardioides piscis]QIK75803.1 hypothetical protein G7071_10475 [Nocardioides piscis]